MQPTSNTLSENTEIDIKSITFTSRYRSEMSAPLDNQTSLKKNIINSKISESFAINREASRLQSEVNEVCLHAP